MLGCTPKLKIAMGSFEPVWQVLRGIFYIEESLAAKKQKHSPNDIPTAATLHNVKQITFDDIFKRRRLSSIKGD